MRTREKRAYTLAGYGFMMSSFFTDRLKGLRPYTPGEQPGERRYVKLNTNESPFAPSEKALAYMRERQRSLNLYPDPECVEIRNRLAEYHDISPENIIAGNGSDELLFFSFRAFCDEERPAFFPDITYGFYPVFAEINQAPYTELPLKEDFSIDISDYKNRKGVCYIANPNAPTGKALSPDEIRELLDASEDALVIVDEAYVDFGAVSCIPLIKEYDNLLVIQTFSKSRSMAGARFGFAAGCRELINDLNTIRYSFNPYNINSMTMALAEGVLADDEYTVTNCAMIEAVREYTSVSLREKGFEVLRSRANFIFVRSDRIGGELLYRALRDRGVLVRHFDKERIKDYNRITIGSREQMDIFLSAVNEIIK